MAPIVHGLESEYDGRIVFTYLDIDDKDNEPFKKALGFRVQPHFVLLDGEGNVLKQWIGRVSRDEFIQAFQEALE